MAHKIGSGSTKNNRDSNPKYLGLKCTHLQKIKKGNILVRQHGQLYKPGFNVKCGKDFTLYSLINGYIFFKNKNIISVFKKLYIF